LALSDPLTAGFQCQNALTKYSVIETGEGSRLTRSSQGLDTSRHKHRLIDNIRLSGPRPRAVPHLRRRKQRDARDSTAVRELPGFDVIIAALASEPSLPRRPTCPQGTQLASAPPAGRRGGGKAVQRSLEREPGHAGARAVLGLSGAAEGRLNAGRCGDADGGRGGSGVPITHSSRYRCVTTENGSRRRMAESTGRWRCGRRYPRRIGTGHRIGPGGDGGPRRRRS